MPQHRSQQSQPVHSLPPLRRSNSNGMQQSLYEHWRNPAPPGGPPSHQTPTPTISQHPQVSQAGDRTPTYSIPPYSTHSACSTSSSNMLSPSTPAAAPHGALGAPQPGVPSPYVIQPAPLGDEEQPVHVVGSQGRRGILPYAQGRPQATLAIHSVSRITVIPPKDEDGRFPCPHCQKTYMQAKHLKRHLLRHTGERPYMCVLCRNTFSRSDIQKRHSQKYYLRRGKPQGISSNLSDPQAHVKKYAAAQQGQSQSAPKPPSGMSGESDNLHGLGSHRPEGIHYGFPMSDSISNLQGNHSQLSWIKSLRELENGGAAGQDRAANLSTTSRCGGYGGYGGGNPPQQMPGNQNGIPMYGGDSSSNHASDIEWPQMFQSGAHYNACASTSHAFHPDVT